MPWRAIIQKRRKSNRAVDNGTNGIASGQRTVKKKDRKGDNGEVLETASETKKKNK